MIATARRQPTVGRALAAAAFAALTVGAVVATGPAQSATPAPRFLVTQRDVGGAPLGKAARAYRRHFRSGSRLERLEDGYERLAFPSRRLEIYFRTGRPGGVAIVASGRRYRTARGVGPCSRVADLRAAYGRLLRPVRFAGETVAYRAGNLVFGAERPGAVTGVMLARPTDPSALFLLLNAAECGPA